MNSSVEQRDQLHNSVLASTAVLPVDFAAPAATSVTSPSPLQSSCPRELLRMQEIPFESICDLRWHCTTSRHMMFVGRFAGEPVLLKSPRHDVLAEAFKATVRIQPPSYAEEFTRIRANRHFDHIYFDAKLNSRTAQFCRRS
jgi:hypothetical protein